MIPIVLDTNVLVRYVVRDWLGKLRLVAAGPATEVVFV